MNSTARKQANSLDDALALLDDAASKSQREVTDMIRNDYQHLKQVLQDIRPDVESAVSTIGDRTTEIYNTTKEKATELSKEAAVKVDSHVMENRWWYVGGAALAGGTLGFLLGRKSPEK